MGFASLYPSYVLRRSRLDLDMVSVLFAGATHKTRNLRFGHDAAAIDRTPAIGTPYCLPLRPLNLLPGRRYVVGINGETAAPAAGDIEDLANWQPCRRADRGFACGDASVRGIRAERRNTECESG